MEASLWALFLKTCSPSDDSQKTWQAVCLAYCGVTATVNGATGVTDAFDAIVINDETRIAVDAYWFGTLEVC